jgi:hypothetical protein
VEGSNKLKTQLAGLLLLSSVYLSGCNSEASETVNAQNVQAGITYKVIHSGISSYGPDVMDSMRSAKVFTHEFVYEADLAKYVVEQPIAVDFGASSVVALSMLSKPPFKSLVSISSVIEFDNHVVVNILLSVPNNSCLSYGVAPESSYLYAMINTRKTILFNEQYVMRSGCGV